MPCQNGPTFRYGGRRRRLPASLLPAGPRTRRAGYNARFLPRGRLRVRISGPDCPALDARRVSAGALRGLAALGWTGGYSGRARLAEGSLWGEAALRAAAVVVLRVISVVASANVGGFIRLMFKLLSPLSQCRSNLRNVSVLTAKQCTLNVFEGSLFILLGQTTL